MSRIQPPVLRAVATQALREIPFTSCQEAPVGHALPGTFFQGARS